MYKILNVDPDEYNKEALERLRQVGQVNCKSISRQDLKVELPHYDGIIARFSHVLDEDLLRYGHNLKFIASATTGLDHIDVDYAAKKSIKIFSLKGEREFLNTVRATPEYTLGLLLSIMRYIPLARDNAINGPWQRDLFRGNEIYGKTVGLIGYGRVGKILRTYFEALGAKVVYYDPYVADAVALKCENLKDLLSRSHIVCITAALTGETIKLIGEKEFSFMRPDCILINTARGPILDEEALLAKLSNCTQMRAALDVLSHEETLRAGGGANPLIDFARCHPDRLIITPHIAGATFDSMARTELFIADKIYKYLTGLNKVNK